MLYSFDVFDTLITRKTATFRGIFAIMGRVLRESEEFAHLPLRLRENFYELRIGSEQQARRVFCHARDRAEITLEEIYEILRLTDTIPEADTAALCALERELEVSNSLGLKRNIRRALKLKAAGERVVLISDMYLDKKTIRRMLGKADPELAALPLYISSEYGHSKYERRLYEIVREAENAEYSDWVHTGDNPYVDGAVPETLGIKTRPCPAKTLLPIEQKALERFPDDADAEFRIGAAANLRLIQSLEEKYTDDIRKTGTGLQRNGEAWRFGASFCATFITPYLEWVLYEAVRQDIGCLYFIARDGYLMKKMADELIRSHGLPVRTVYIYGSREAWRAPSLFGSNWDIPELFRWSDIKTMPLCELSKVFGLPKETLPSLFPHLFSSPDQVLTREEYQALKGELYESSALREAVEKANADKRRVLLQYLKENIDLSEPNLAFVELIGSGYSQVCLSSLLGELTKAPLINFFLHLDAHLTREGCRFFCYAPCHFPGQERIELFFSAPHGRTVGYKEDEDKRAVPVLNEEHLPIMAYGLEEMHRGSLECLRLYCDSMEKRTDPGNSALPLFYMKYLAQEPDRELADFVGDMPYGAGVRGGDVDRFAPRLTPEELKLIYAIRDNEPLEIFVKRKHLDLSLCRLTKEEQELVRGFKQLAEIQPASLEAEREKFWASRGGIDPKISLWGFDYGQLKKRIAVYGAGKIGKRLVRALHLDSERELVVWVDRNYPKLREQGYEVDPVEELRKADFEQVVIALLSPEAAAEARNALLELGVAKEKIILYRPG